MPRGSKASGSRGKARRGGRGNFRTAYDARLSTSFAGQSTSSNPDSGRGTFTLQEEARNTKHHWGDSDQKLRNSKVSFISAGSYEPPSLKEAIGKLSLVDDEHRAASESQLEELKIEVTIEVDDEIEVIVEEDNEESPVAEELLPNHYFTVDTLGGEAIETGIRHPRCPSPAPSNSSEEVILFNGRNKRPNVASHDKPLRQNKVVTITDTLDAQIHLVEEKIQEQQELLQETLVEDKELYQSGLSSEPTDNTQFSSILPRKHARRDRGRSRRHESIQKHEEEAMIADYIANLESEEDGGLDDMLKSFHKRDLGLTGDEDLWQEDTEISSEDIVHPTHAEWDRSDLHDFEDLSTSDMEEKSDQIKAIYAKRERPTGTQYLVVMKQHSLDDAKWLAANTVAFHGAINLIDEFEAKEDADNAQNQRDSEDSDVETDSGDVNAGKFKFSNGHTSDIDDEQLARLLNKQEELGMGSHSLLLLDDGAQKNAFGIGATKKTLNSSKARSKRPRGEYQTTTKMGDNYDGFDIMDFERPSLKTKAKGRRGKFPYDISDSELEAAAQSVWEIDRLKKKKRKEMREELRSQGLLGSKSGKPILKDKYREGMGFHQVQTEIREFLMGSETTMALPPMDKADRKIVHEIANAFNLKSKSVGGSAKRFPVLYKTSRTVAYLDSTYTAVEDRLSRRFLRRPDVGHRYDSKRGGRGGGGGTNSGAVTYRDGDVVGGSAPELGAENKGRAMLEKMGWSSGTALGAPNNKGIMLPVTHIVKNSKAGLG